MIGQRGAGHDTAVVPVCWEGTSRGDDDADIFLRQLVGQLNRHISVLYERTRSAHHPSFVPTQERHPHFRRNLCLQPHQRGHDIRLIDMYHQPPLALGDALERARQFRLRVHLAKQESAEHGNLVRDGNVHVVECEMKGN